MAYKKENDTSFTLGAFPTMELLRKKPEKVKKIYLHKDLTKSEDIEKIINLAQKYNIVCETKSHLIENISKKDNVYIVAEFEKYIDKIDKNNQIVLYNPSDMGNVGTIFRTALGFGFKNIIMIAPCVDYFNPKVIRASMGAVFSLNVVVYDSFEKYVADFPKIDKYLFMLDGNNILQELNAPSTTFALVFGNEASGLPADIKKYGTPVFIRHSNEIDSLNLAISASIAMFKFSK